MAFAVEGERLGVVEHAQDRPGHVEATLAKLDEEVFHESGVLDVVLFECEADSSSVFSRRTPVSDSVTCPTLSGLAVTPEG